MAATAAPSITFYTNRRCPWAQRAQITLKELGLDYKEVTIDLDTPREPWYLKVNPRGLVPSIEYSGDGVEKQIITESAIVSQFLADAHPSHLTAPSGENGAQQALFRARANFFVDTFFGKVQSHLMGLLKADGAEREAAAETLVAAIKKELEPLLADAAPFFGGAKKLTIAEALTGPFVLRQYTFIEAGIIPTAAAEAIKALPNYSKWAAAVIAQDSVKFAFDPEQAIAKAKSLQKK